MVEVLTADKLEKLSIKAVDRFFSAIKELSQSQEEIYIAISGGSSVKSFYHELEFLLHLKSLSHVLDGEEWGKLRFCLADERIVPLDHKDSNMRESRAEFLDFLIEERFIVEEQIIPIDPYSRAPDLYYNTKVPQVDIALLGVGPEGHTCSLFPNHPLLLSEAESYVLIEDSPKPPARRITMAPKMFPKLKYSFIFFIGESKEDAYHLFKDQHVNERRCPAKLALQARQCYVITDLE